MSAVDHRAVRDLANALIAAVEEQPNQNVAVWALLAAAASFFEQNQEARAAFLAAAAKAFDATLTIGVVR